MPEDYRKYLRREFEESVAREAEIGGPSPMQGTFLNVLKQMRSEQPQPMSVPPREKPGFGGALAAALQGPEAVNRMGLRIDRADEAARSVEAMNESVLTAHRENIRRYEVLAAEADTQHQDKLTSLRGAEQDLRRRLSEGMAKVTSEDNQRAADQGAAATQQYNTELGALQQQFSEIIGGDFAMYAATAIGGGKPFVMPGPSGEPVAEFAPWVGDPDEDLASWQEFEDLMRARLSTIAGPKQENLDLLESMLLNMRSQALRIGKNRYETAAGGPGVNRAIGPVRLSAGTPLVTEATVRMKEKLSAEQFPKLLSKVNSDPAAFNSLGPKAVLAMRNSYETSTPITAENISLEENMQLARFIAGKEYPGELPAAGLSKEAAFKIIRVLEAAKGEKYIRFYDDYGTNTEKELARGNVRPNAWEFTKTAPFVLKGGKLAYDFSKPIGKFKPLSERSALDAYLGQRSREIVDLQNARTDAGAFLGAASAVNDTIYSENYEPGYGSMAEDASRDAQEAFDRARERRLREARGGQ